MSNTDAAPDVERDSFYPSDPPPFTTRALSWSATTSS